MSQEDYSRVLKRQLGCCGLGAEVGVSAYVCAAFMATADAAGAFLSLLNPEYMYVCVYIYICIYIFTLLLFQRGDDLRLAEAGEGWYFVFLILKQLFLGTVSLLTGVPVANCPGSLRVLDPPSSFIFNVICFLTSSHLVLGSRDLKTNKQGNFKYSCRYFLDGPDMIFLLPVLSHLVSLIPIPRLLASFYSIKKRK